MKIFLGTDHAGYELKESLKVFLEALGHEVEDKGAYEKDQFDDYPDFVRPVALAVAATPGSRGIVLGKTGEGEAMDANRVTGVRATAYYGSEPEILKLSREHNDANILSLGAGFISSDTAKEAVKLWLDTPFSGLERHARRIRKLDE